MSLWVDKEFALLRNGFSFILIIMYFYAPEGLKKHTILLSVLPSVHQGFLCPGHSSVLYEWISI